MRVHTMTLERWRIVALALLAIAGIGTSAQTPSRPRLFVVQPPDAIVEYDVATFGRGARHSIPPAAAAQPGALQINAKGQMLFLPATVREPDGLMHDNTAPTFWFWDGSAARILNRQITSAVMPAGADRRLETGTPRVFLTADGTHLVWVETRRNTLQRSGQSLDISVDTTFDVWQTDLMGGSRQPLASYTFPSCRCPTGVCEETCPEALYWLGRGGLAEAFVVTHWIPGQVSPTYQESLLYRRSRDGWSASRLPAPVEDVLDVSMSGSDVVLIESVPDGGCCGWDNESDDRTVVATRGRSVVVFDEFERYQNRDYDVSFFTFNARMAPGAGLAAFTVTATHRPGAPIRLADSGASNPAELERIRKDLTGLPEVDVVRVSAPDKPALAIPHATLVGWLSDREILIVENQAVVAVDVATGARRDSHIRVSNPAYAFVR